MRVVNSKTVHVTPRKPPQKDRKSKDRLAPKKPPFKKSASNRRLYITVDKLRALMPEGTLLHAANELGICVSTLKKACRHLGINGWKTKSRKKKAQTGVKASNKKKEQTGVKASNSNRFPREYNGTNDNQQQPVPSTDLRVRKAIDSKPYASQTVYSDWQPELDGATYPLYIGVHIHPFFMWPFISNIRQEIRADHWSKHFQGEGTDTLDGRGPSRDSQGYSDILYPRNINSRQPTGCSSNEPCSVNTSNVTEDVNSSYEGLSFLRSEDPCPELNGVPEGDGNG